MPVIKKITGDHFRQYGWVIFFLSVSAVILFQILRVCWFAVKAGPIYSQAPFSRHNPSARFKILFIGDSTAVGTGALDNQKTTAGYFGRDFPDAHIANFGKNGQRLKDILEGFSPVENEKYTLMVIQIGGNDILRFTPLKEVRRDLSIILSRAKRLAGHVVILHSGNIGAAPLFSWPFNFIYTARTKKVREIYLQIAKEKGALYIDLFTETSEDIFLKDTHRFYCSDYLHPSGDGYLMWYNKIRKALAEAKVL